MFSVILCVCLYMQEQPTKAVVWGADWCPACKQMKPVATQLQNDGWPIEYKNIDEFPAEAMQQIGGDGIPMTVIPGAGKFSGFRPLGSLIELLTKSGLKQKRVSVVSENIKGIAWYTLKDAKTKEAFQSLQKAGWPIIITNIEEYADTAKLWGVDNTTVPCISIYSDSRSLATIKVVGKSGKIDVDLAAKALAMRGMLKTR